MKSFLKNKRKFIFGSFIYHYDLVKQDRKTLSLTITPDLHIGVRCPHNADNERIELFLKRKWFWLEKQISFFGKYQRKHYKREYVSGESFRYLGRQYKLVVKRGTRDKVSLLGGVLLVYTTRGMENGSYTKRLISGWYDEKTDEIFRERFEDIKKKFKYEDVLDLKIRDMRRRWGSFVTKNKVILNPKLIYMSKDCIDYVITHELCHLQYKKHNKDFFKLLDKKLPKWKKTKEKLEMMGSLI